MDATIKLVSNGKGLSSYDTPDHQYRVIKHEGRSWSGSRGSYAWTKWVAFSMTETNNQGFPLTVAEGSTIKSLKTRLARYLAYRAAGCVLHYSKYGVFQQ